VETKKVLASKNFQLTDYKLKSGHYVFTYGQIVKREFADGDDLEKTIADKFDHPYDFKILKSEMVGTNDCIVVARCMTPKFLDAIKAIYYKDYTKEQEAQFGGDPRKFIGSETDYYFKKSDGVTFGQISRNHLGQVLQNYLYDKVEINQPIPDQEFILPQGDTKIAKSIEEDRQIFHQLRAAKRAKDRESPAAILSAKRLAELPWATDLPKALAQAKAEHKIVLLDFTGSDWCMWCRRFEEDVLSQPEFASYAKTNLVMVMADFPHEKPQSDFVKKANEGLQSQFKIDGFPTYVVLTPAGTEIGRQVGYLSGGPMAFIAMLRELSRK
jgi:protein disulfide-isomerase